MNACLVHAYNTHTVQTKGATTKCFERETILCKDYEYTAWILTSLRIYFNQKGECVVHVPVNIIELIKKKLRTNTHRHRATFPSHLFIV